MKTLVVKTNPLGKEVEIEVKKIYEESPGKWVAEVDEAEVHHAYEELCGDRKDCSYENMHAQADLDDDGKEYRILKV